MIRNGNKFFSAPGVPLSGTGGSAAPKEAGCAVREQKSELTVPSAQSPGLVLQAVESFCLTEPLRALSCKDIIDSQVKIHLEVVRLYMQSLTREMCVW